MTCLLESWNLTKYCAAFEENEVNGVILMNCKSVDDVKELGISLTAKARFFLNEIIEYKMTGVPLGDCERAGNREIIKF